MLLHDNLACRAGGTLVVRGGTSALGQAAINLARNLDVRVIATTRSPDKRLVLEALGALARGSTRRQHHALSRPRGLR